MKKSSKGGGGGVTRTRKVAVNEKSENISVWKKLKMGYNPMEEGVRWTEKYADTLESTWNRIPVFLQKVLVVLAIALLGSSLKGEWIDERFFSHPLLFKNS